MFGTKKKKKKQTKKQTKKRALNGTKELFNHHYKSEN